MSTRPQRTTTGVSTAEDDLGDDESLGRDMPDWGDIDPSQRGAGRQKSRPTASAPSTAKAPSPVTSSSPVTTASRARPTSEPKAAASEPKAAAPTKVAEDSQAKAEAEAAAERAVAVKGIEGTMSEYDVKSTLEGRAREFDRCHDVRGRARSGRIAFRIRVLPDGKVSDVRVRQSSVRDRELVGCYTDVIMASTFPTPHGGYADVNWSTKVGRSRPRPGDIFERVGRWDAPSGSSQSRPSRRESRRTKRRHRSDG